MQLTSVSGLCVPYSRNADLAIAATYTPSYNLLVHLWCGDALTLKVGGENLLAVQATANGHDLFVFDSTGIMSFKNDTAGIVWYYLAGLRFV